MAIHNNKNNNTLFDTTLLYCDEQQESNLVLLDQDLIWDDEELHSLFLKQKQTFVTRFSCPMVRKQAVKWILDNNARFGFSALTAILAVNYLDRFLSTLSFDNQPWIMQLASVTCLSLAAKVEETHVPLLLQLQVGATEFVFEPKNIQRMELLVLSALNWRMNPVTPISFIDHIIRRLRFESYSHSEFLHCCENILLSVVSDSRFVLYLPSVLATATMLHVIHQCNDTDYENQILTLLKISKEEVKDCYEFIGLYTEKKRKLIEIENSRNGAADVAMLSSNGAWSISSSPQQEPIHKKKRIEEQKMKLGSLTRGFVDGID